MKSKWKNAVEVQGYIFNFGNDERRQLKERISGPNSAHPGTEYIQGELNVATDDEASNVVTIWFQYVPKVWPAKNGKPERENPTYAELARLINTAKTFESDGTAATKVRVSGNLDVNDFYTREGELASPKRIRGGFVHVLNGPISPNPATFDIECILSQAINKEVEDGDDYLTLKGYTFDFRNSILPFEVNVRIPAAIAYFENQEISNSNPLVTNIKGNIVSAIVNKEVEVESAFGEPVIEISTRTVRTWDVTWAAKEPMEWDDESSITKAELKKALQEREDTLAAEKKRQDEWKASQGSSFSAAIPAAKASSPEDDDDFAF